MWWWYHAPCAPNFSQLGPCYWYPAILECTRKTLFIGYYFMYLVGTRTITLCPLCTKFPSIRTALKTSLAGHLLLLTSRGKTIRSRHRRWQQFKQSRVRFIFCWNWIKYKCQTKWCMWKQPPFVKCYILCLPNSAYQRVKFQRPLCTRTKIYISAFPNAGHSTVL